MEIHKLGAQDNVKPRLLTKHFLPPHITSLQEMLQLSPPDMRLPGTSFVYFEKMIMMNRSAQ